MKKILIVSSSLDTGGAQKMISNITTALPDGWEADILLNTAKNIQFAYRGNIISLDIPEPKSRTSLWYQTKVLIKRLFKLYQLKKQNNYQACISLLDSANVANIITGKKYCKVVITAVVNMSESAYIKAYRYVVFPLIRIFYNHASVIVAQNSAIRDDLIEHFGIRKELFSIIYNGINSDSIEKIAELKLAEEERTWFDKNNTIISAGRLTYAKGQWHLIRAFSEVVKQKPDAKLVIFGQGELKEYLQELIQAYHLENNACIRGFDSELDKYIANSAVFAFPSMIEGMPTVLLEAMTCKTMCIVTDFKSGAREIMDYPAEGSITHTTEANYGIITPICSGKYWKAQDPLEENEKILAAAMTKALQDEAYRKTYEERGKERSRYFDMKNLIWQWLAVAER